MEDVPPIVLPPSLICTIIDCFQAIIAAISSSFRHSCSCSWWTYSFSKFFPCSASSLDLSPILKIRMQLYDLPFESRPGSRAHRWVSFSIKQGVFPILFEGTILAVNYAHAYGGASAWSLLRIAKSVALGSSWTWLRSYWFWLIGDLPLGAREPRAVLLITPRLSFFFGWVISYCHHH